MNEGGSGAFKDNSPLPLDKGQAHLFKKHQKPKTRVDA